MNYYYLITSLPELSIDDPSSQIDVEEILDFINRNLSDEDQATGRYLIYPNDNYNLVNQIFEKFHNIPATEFRTPSIFDQEEIQQFIRKEYKVPEYMNNFMDFHRGKLDLLRPSRIEEYLWTDFYKEVATLDNRFIIDYYEYDRTLRHLAFIHNSNLFEESPISEFVSDPINRQLGLSRPESVLVQTYPFVSDLYSALDSKNPMIIEKTMDRIRWDFIDGYEIWSSFSNTQVFGWMLKLVHHARWSALTEDKGKLRSKELTEGAIMASGISEINKL